MYFASYLQSFVVLLYVALQVAASKGDRARPFKQCVADCESRLCSSGNSLPISLQLTFWTCTEDCRYRCMHNITTRDLHHRAPLKQYYGKWAFWRLGGVQEPASVAFSLWNFIGHVNGLRRLKREIGSEHPMKAYYIWWAFASMNTWVWSAVFHCRDKPFTERMDYFSAAATILYGLYFSVIRLFHLYRPSKSKTRGVWTFACALALISHIAYLSLLSRFDYTYNIVANSVVGLTHNFLWLLYAFPSSFFIITRFPSRPKAYRPRFVVKAVWLVLATTAATGLELFDFPPIWRVIDAHSLWHLSTAVIAPYWYQFLVEDSNDEGWRPLAKKSS